MHPYYHDILNLTSLDPIWFTPEGVPRYCEFQPFMISIYADYSVLYEIHCQDCGRSFQVGDDYDRSDMLMMRLDHTRMSEEELKWVEDKTDVWIFMRQGLYAPHFKDENGNNVYKTLTIEEMIRGYHYGDPPSHGCIGDTMNSVPRSTLQVWNNHAGRETEERKGYSVITKWGEPAHMPELEGLDLTPDWFLPTQNVVAIPAENVPDW